MLTRWNPGSDLFQLHRAMDRLFDEIISPPQAGRMLATYQLPIDVLDEDGEYKIVAPVAGFKPEQVEVTFNDGLLTIDAKAETKTESKEDRHIRREWVQGNLYRQVSLPGEIDAEAIKATFENGILTVTVPKVAPAAPKRIPVTATQPSTN